jgi:hypothetical protein
MAAEPFNWVSWQEARHRMPEIWDGWHYFLSADHAMVSSLRRGNVPCRGEAYGLGLWPTKPISLREVVAGLLSLRSSWSLFAHEAEYETTEWRTVLTIGGYQGQPTKVKKTATLDKVELAWDEFRDDLIRYELPAGVKPKKSSSSPSRPGPKAGEQNSKDLACRTVLVILNDHDRRPSLGYGRLIALARLVNAELSNRGYKYQDDSVRKMIGRTVREWETLHTHQ